MQRGEASESGGSNKRGGAKRGRRSQEGSEFERERERERNNDTDRDSDRDREEGKLCCRKGGAESRLCMP
eukprot:2796275-Pleurochrysis_carterae.AAC.1